MPIPIAGSNRSDLTSPSIQDHGIGTEGLVMDLKRISKELGAVSGVSGTHWTPPARAPEGAKDADRVELSGEAQGVLSGYEAALALAGMPAVVREERITDVQARVAER